VNRASRKARHDSWTSSERVCTPASTPRRRRASSRMEGVERTSRAASEHAKGRSSRGRPGDFAVMDRSTTWHRRGSAARSWVRDRPPCAAAPLASVLARARNAIRTPADLAGKTVGGHGVPSTTRCSTRCSGRDWRFTHPQSHRRGHGFKAVSPLDGGKIDAASQPSGTPRESSSSDGHIPTAMLGWTSSAAPISELFVATHPERLISAIWLSEGSAGATRPMTKEPELHSRPARRVPDLESRLPVGPVFGGGALPVWSAESLPVPGANPCQVTVMRRPGDLWTGGRRETESSQPRRWPQSEGSLRSAAS